MSVFPVLRCAPLIMYQSTMIIHFALLSFDEDTSGPKGVWSKPTMEATRLMLNARALPFLVTCDPGGRLPRQVSVGQLDLHVVWILGVWDARQISQVFAPAYIGFWSPAGSESLPGVNRELWLASFTSDAHKSNYWFMVFLMSSECQDQRISNL